MDDDENAVEWHENFEVYQFCAFFCISFELPQAKKFRQIERHKHLPPKIQYKTLEEGEWQNKLFITFLLCHPFWRNKLIPSRISFDFGEINNSIT